MAALSDLLVSYKQVRVPTKINSVEPPLDRYNRLIQYQQAKEDDIIEPEEEFDASKFKWRYDPKSKTQTNMDAPLPTNNTPVIPRNEWTKKLAQAYRDLKVSENGIRNLIAKNALESRWGEAAQGRYNYGNITTGRSWTGEYVNGRDHDANGNPITNKFRSYNSIEEFAKDELAFLKRLYDFNDSDDIDTFTTKLQGGNKGGRKYASDPKYGSKVKQLYKQLG